MSVDRTTGKVTSEVIDDQRPSARATGKLQDALMLVKEATEILPDSPEWDKHRTQLKVDVARLTTRIFEIDHAEPQL